MDARKPSLRWTLGAPLIAALLGVCLWSPVQAKKAALRTVIVGGGPSLTHNQVAIERNVFYVSHLLPSGTPRYVLFADGDPSSKTVLFQEPGQELSPGERAFTLLFGNRAAAHPTVLKYRAPELGSLEGPARREAVTNAFNWLRQGPGDPVLLYFTGHGSPAKDKNLDNNVFDLWGGEDLSVQALAAHIATLPPDLPVTVVMVQCFSGAFGNLVFTGGDPKAPAISRPIAGFFAATPDRTAAGCTPELNEAEYHDFTSYFFAALSGRDRVGRAVRGADYNRDGRVGMDEAFCYSLAHDLSTDVPVCTSDTFLRAAPLLTDDKVFETAYSHVRDWATPGQAAALDELAAGLELSGETRPKDAYALLRGQGAPSPRPASGTARQRYLQTRNTLRTPLLARWPVLSTPNAPAYPEARGQAIAELDRVSDEGPLKELLAADAALGDAEDEDYREELRQARVLRFVRVCKSVVLAHQLRESGDPALKKRFEQLVKAEARTLIPPASGS